MTYCVMAVFRASDQEDEQPVVTQTFTVFVDADNEDDARERGKRVIARQVHWSSNWDRKVSVYREEQFDTLRQFGILPSKKGGTS